MKKVLLATIAVFSLATTGICMAQGNTKVVVKSEMNGKMTAVSKKGTVSLTRNNAPTTTVSTHPGVEDYTTTAMTVSGLDASNIGISYQEEGHSMMTCSKKSSKNMTSSQKYTVSKIEVNVKSNSCKASIDLKAVH